jgi:mono/diheme cytochrome c family protein
MLRFVAFAVAVGLSLSAQADPFTKADPTKGKMLADKSCIACHSSQFGGDGSRIYTRPDHRIKSANQLLQQVTRCSQAANTDWSTQEITDVAAYLNQAFYKFQ